jgi:Flp pilus assembly protein TadD
MAPPGARTLPAIRTLLLATAVLAAVAACQGDEIPQTPYAPGVDLRKDAVDGIEVAQRLMAAGQYELALDAYTRAALDEGLTPEIRSGMAGANLGLGRLNQAEKMLREVVAEEPDWPEAWNNLGVVLMEQGKTAEAQLIFQKAYALDNGESDSIRDNLRLALAKVENPDNTVEQNDDYKLVREGRSEYAIRKTP